MIEKITYIESDQFSPYRNLAVEEYLLLHCEDKECILYLWQNQNTVVIGRNRFQVPFRSGQNRCAPYKMWQSLPTHFPEKAQIKLTSVR